MIYLIIVYIIFLIAFGIYSFFMLYHLNEYGYEGDATRPVMIIYIISALTIIFVSFLLLLIGG